MIEDRVKVKKNTYALKTPQVVFLTVYSSTAPCVKSSMFSKRHAIEIPIEAFFDLVTLIFDLWPWYTKLTKISFQLNYMPKFKSLCPFGRESGNRRTGRQAGRQTHRRRQNYYNWHVTDIGCNNSLHDFCISDRQPRESHRKFKNLVIMWRGLTCLVWLPIKQHVVVNWFHFQGSNGKSW